MVPSNLTPSSDPAISVWETYSPRKWAVRWLRSQRELIVSAARDRAHARKWLEKEARKAESMARRLMDAPKLAERQIELLSVIRNEALVYFDAWYAGEWEPAEPDA